MPLPSSNLRRARPLLGTLVEICAQGSPDVLPAAVEHAFAAIDRVQALMSFHDERSDVSRLNRDAHRRPVEIDPQTWAVLAHARGVSEASGGAFDVTVAPRLVEWGYLPGRGQVLPAVRPDAYRAIELLPGERVRFRKPVLIDLGGIAKGYAVDVACGALEQFGVMDYVVNAGGDLRVGSGPTTVHVRQPSDPTVTLALGTLQGAAVATSASYFARKRGRHRELHPIVAPHTAGPAIYRGSISVKAADCVTADALTKVVAVLGDAAMSALQRFGAEACLLSESGEWRPIPDRVPGQERPAGRDAGVATGQH